ncbi:hypothetical protein GOBAR_DD07033 [Gossypium barbadense]|nr:hypothetical protein GOBAR_DD07033 [Gossypium barbadense]
MSREKLRRAALPPVQEVLFKRCGVAGATAEEENGVTVVEMSAGKRRRGRPSRNQVRITSSSAPPPPPQRKDEDDEEDVECTSLNQELQDMEARFVVDKRSTPEEANQMLQTWQEEVERARQGQRDAERKLSSLEASIIIAEVQKMRVEMAAMKRDAEHYSCQVKKLQQQLQKETDLHLALASAVEHCGSPSSSSPGKLPDKAQELLDSIAVLEITIAKLQQALHQGPC